MSEKIGPGNPPRATRFQKGQSGNPKGRPKAKRPPEPSAFDVLLRRTVKIIQGGVEREVTPEEAIQQQVLQAAFAGNASAGRQVLKWIEIHEKALAARAKPAVVRIPSRIVHDPENANEALLLLGIATRLGPGARREQYQQLLLEPWAVQKALSRRHGGERLTEQEIQEIKRCTRDPEALRWPRSSEG
jgi:hypothetical protein